MADETTERPLARVKYKEDETSGFLPKKEAVTPVIIPSPVKAYTHNMGRSRVVSAMWEAPEWDLAEVGRIIDVEAYVRRAFAVREALFMKEGYEFVGQNPTRVSYVRRRFQQIEAATGIPIKILFQRTVGSLIALHNAFWVKKRDKKASGGKSYKLNGQTFDPVAGYFIAPAETIRFKRDEYGRILKYRQSVWGKEEVEFNPEDVIHFYFDKRDGFSVGTPITVPIKDDIRALRRIEENIELLYYQYLFPLFHYKVGTEKNPAMTFPDGTTEIELVQRELANMPSDGLWVTPERHEIEVKGSEGKALDPKDVLEHFKQRVFSGLGVSNVDMGEGGSANRSTAQTLSRNLIDRTKSEQRIFEDFINTFVIKELLRESTFPEESLDDEENQVYLVFKEIDNEVKQALENHCSQMYMQNLLSHDEARDAIGKEPFTEEDWLNSYWRQIEEPKVLMQSLDEPWSAESKAVARSNATSVTEGDIEEETEVAEQHRKEELAAKKVAKTAKPVARPAKASGSAANKNKPRNQHGTRSSAKLNKDCYDSYDARATSELNSIFAQRPPLSTVLYDLEKDVRGMVSNGGWDKETAKIVFGIAFETGRNKLVDHAKRAYRIGINDTSKPYYEINLAPTDAKIERHVTRFTNKLRDYVFEQVESNLVGVKELSIVDAEAASIIFKVLAHRAKMIDEGEIRRAYNAGLADGYKAQGAEEISLLCSDSQPCEICSKSTLRWKTGDAIIYEELPPLHPECNCRLKRN